MMENFETLDQGLNQSEGRLTLSDGMLHFIAVTARWSRFLAIVGFVFIGLIVLFALGAGAFMASMSSAMPFGGMLTVIYLLIAGLYFYPLYTLYMYAVKVRSALESGDQAELETGFQNLASHYKFLGIMTMIVLIFYGILILIGIFGFMKM